MNSSRITMRSWLNRRTLLASAAGSLGFLALSGPQYSIAQVASFSVTLLSPLDGFPDLQPVGVSDDGVVVLNAQAKSTNAVYSWQDGVYARLGGKETNVEATTVSDSGTITGIASSNASGTLGAAIATGTPANRGATVTPVAGSEAVLIADDHLVYMPGESTGSGAVGANSEGMVVGYSTNQAGNRVPTRWSQTEQQLLPMPNNLETGTANAINILDQVVGWVGAEDGRQAAIWNEDQPSILGPLDSGISAASAINDDGVVVGFASLSATPTALDSVSTVAFSWTAGEIAMLPQLQNAVQHAPADINATDMIVGQATLSTGDSRAVIWSSGEIVDLNAMIAESELTLTHAVSVNRFGSILCGAVDASGTAQVALLSVLGN